ncbi:hypothetical protein LJR030_002006 [Rhizobium sp. LjRoot30]|uniref:hypothetical protein n=1 Tax=Rhizobium sp. LjRoot30 TaxID=3342320 RepID=UPI003ED0042F
MIKLSPVEAERAGRVYAQITEEPWFNRNAVTERELLKLVIETVRVSKEAEPQILSSCVEQARERFSRRKR